MSQNELAELISQQQNLRHVLDNLAEGVLAHDKHRIITYFNRAAERITGYHRADVVGRDCHDVFDGGFCGSACHFTEEDIELRREITQPLSFTTKSGERRRLESLVVPMTDDQGEFVGVLNCFRDLTEITWLRRRLEDAQNFNGIIGKDHQMQLVFDLISDLADNEVPVVIQGESGTGKELVASAIHHEGRRNGKPFIPVNCGALPEGTLESELFGHVKGAFTSAIRDKKGRFELADGGTIFLDEVADLTQATQVKLLRVLQDGRFERVGGEQQITVDVRVISATHQDLRKMVTRGTFREDLFYRLCVVPIILPPLRERRNDILLLAEHFLRAACEDSGRDQPVFSQAAISIMMDYGWPGNVRELQNAIQYALVKSKGDTIRPGHLPPEISGQRRGRARQDASHDPGGSGRPRKLHLEQVQRALEACGGNKAKAARKLGVGRATLYRFLNEMQRHGRENRAT